MAGETGTGGLCPVRCRPERLAAGRSSPDGIDVTGVTEGNAALAGQQPRCHSGPGNTKLRMVVRQVRLAERPNHVVAAHRQGACWPWASWAGARDTGPGSVLPGLPHGVTRTAGWRSATRAGAHGAGLGTWLPGHQSVPQAPGWGAAADTVDTTRTGGSTTARAAARQGGACDQFLRGTRPAPSGRVPGNLTGDSPDARKRAAQQRVRG